MRAPLPTLRTCSRATRLEARDASATFVADTAPRGLMRTGLGLKPNRKSCSDIVPGSEGQFPASRSVSVFEVSFRYQILFPVWMSIVFQFPVWRSTIPVEVQCSLPAYTLLFNSTHPQQTKHVQCRLQFARTRRRYSTRYILVSTAASRENNHQNLIASYCVFQLVLQCFRFVHSWCRSFFWVLRVFACACVSFTIRTDTHVCFLCPSVVSVSSFFWCVRVCVLFLCAALGFTDVNFFLISLCLLWLQPKNSRFHTENPAPSFLLL